MVEILCQFYRNNETKTNFYVLSLYSYLDIPYILVHTCPQDAWKRQHTPKPPAQPPLEGVDKTLISTKMIY